MNGQGDRLSSQNIGAFDGEDDYTDPGYSGMFEEETNDLLKKNQTAIRDFSRINKYSRLYNLSVQNNDIISSLQNSKVEKIFEEQNLKFKCNVSIGFILINQTEEKLRYWHASMGHDKLFDTPSLIQNKQDFDSMISELMSKDYIENATKNRPDTSWSVHLITNISFHVFPIIDHSIGCSAIPSERTKLNKAILTSDRDSNGRQYKDNLCLFRAMVYSNGQESTLEHSTNEYFEIFIRETNKTRNEFQGVPLSELQLVERIFTCSINVYTLEYNEDDESIAKLVYRSSTNYKHKLNLHLDNLHFSWIKNLRLYTKSYKCSFCNKLLKTATASRNHSLSCTAGETKLVYPYGVYEPSKTIFDKLEDIGITVDQSRRHYPYFAVFDCEAYLCQDNLPKQTKTITYETVHKLASISVCTNIAGHTEPLNFINDWGEFELVSQMMDYLQNLADLCYERLKIRYKDIFRRINRKGAAEVSKEINASCDRYSVENVVKKFEGLEKELHSYLRDLLVLSFNGAVYDIPLIRQHLIRYLLQNKQNVNFTVKKGNRYMCLQTDKLRFLDVLNYLAPGFSYDDYLKAMGVDGEKFFWPYDIFTSMAVLDRTELPKHEEFYNKMKNSNISIQDYERCKKMWKDKEMRSLRDLLIHYNNEDVKHFIPALERQNEFYKSRNLDFKSAISVPGLAIRYLFQLKDPEAPIFLFGERFKDIHQLIKTNIRGGLSMVFSRYQEAGVTKIKPEYFGSDAKETQVCVGYDATALYLSCLINEMPTGAFVRRKSETNFKIEKSYNAGVKATEWLKWIENELNVKIKHQFNGVEKRIGGRRIPVDGYTVMADGIEVVFNYSGCWYHSHLCVSTPSGKHNSKDLDLQNQIETYKKLKYFKDLGYIVHHIWECEFDQLKRENSTVREFCKSLDFIVDSRYQLSEAKILEEIQSGKMFGMAEVDIETPESLKEIYSEYQPIQKHANVSRNDIGDHMRKFAEENGLLKKPTRSLLNSYFGKKILLATPLLQWYLNHGLVVTKLYQVIQYKPSKCFDQFGQAVMSARREGDCDPSKKIISDSCKLIGQSNVSSINIYTKPITIELCYKSEVRLLVVTIKLCQIC